MGSPLNNIYIYGDSSIGINFENLFDYVRGLFSALDVEIRRDFLGYHLVPEMLDPLAERLASIKILDPIKEGLNSNPIYGEIDYEKRKILNPSSNSVGVMYDGFRLQSILYSLIPKDEKGFDRLHIVLTNQLILTWDSYDRRYHLRVAIFGQPSIISTSGMVEAPAKPREFYILKQMIGIGALTMADLKKRFDKRFIDYGDSRMTEVAKGYLAQAIFYHISGEPFCEDRGCRLFNAHWQEEMIYAQIESPYEFCDRHKVIIQQLRNVEQNLSLSF